MENSRQIEFFNLNNDGDSAIVRLLHSKVGTIESAGIHRISVDGKYKNVKCPGEGCPICVDGTEPLDRIYVHLFDYTDDKEKVWCRTSKILKQFEEIEKDWGNLSECVVRITRKGKEFPKYTVDILNAKNYAPVDNELVDNKIAYRFYMTRSVDEIKTFLKTGEMPKHVSTFVSKEEYAKRKKEESENKSDVKPNTKHANFVESTAKTTEKVEKPKVETVVDDDPFMDACIKPRK